jgi:hypothetical protein
MRRLTMRERQTIGQALDAVGVGIHMVVKLGSVSRESSRANAILVYLSILRGERDRQRDETNANVSIPERKI